MIIVITIYNDTEHKSNDDDVITVLIRIIIKKQKNTDNAINNINDQNTNNNDINDNNTTNNDNDITIPIFDHQISTDATEKDESNGMFQIVDHQIRTNSTKKNVEGTLKSEQFLKKCQGD